MNNNKSNVSQWGFQWNDAINWEVLNYTESYGRKFIRHPSDMGTVMSMDDGTERNILILDAQYRKTGCYAYYYSVNESVDLGLTQCQNIGYFAGSKQTLPFIGISDATINASSAYYDYANLDPNTSRYNTDKLVSLGDGARAANYCRSIKITHNGIEIGCDMPNINVLCRMYAAMIKLDSMDPTIDYYPELALSKWWSSYCNCCWSSSWYGYSGNDYCAFRLGHNSSGYGYYQDSSLPGLAAILEI